MNFLSAIVLLPGDGSNSRNYSKIDFILPGLVYIETSVFVYVGRRILSKLWLTDNYLAQ